MRIIAQFTKNTEKVPIANQSKINRYIHNCLGKNNIYHDRKNDYCISHLYGGKLNEDKYTLNFENGGIIVITSKNEDFLNAIIGGIADNKYLSWGMEFKQFEFIKEQLIDGWNYFATLSPFIIKEYKNKNLYNFITLDDKDFNNKITNYIKNKISKIDDKLDISNLRVEVPYNNKHKVKKILIKNVINKANQCQLNIFCNKKVAELIYNYGFGQSTGSGFGTIYKTENHNKY